jgi:heptaprenyl diphosphate synthase
MADYGRNLGVAYALVEDVLCLETPERLAESPIASDLSAGILSLPIIRALERGGTLAADTGELLRTRAYSALGRSLASAGLLDEARTTARRFAEDAIASVRNLPASSVTRALERLADYAVTRRLPVQGTLPDVFRTEPS